MSLLCARGKKGDHGLKKAGEKLKQKPMALIDLDNSDENDDKDGDSGVILAA